MLYSYVSSTIYTHWNNFTWQRVHNWELQKPRKVKLSGGGGGCQWTSAVIITPVSGQRHAVNVGIIKSYRLHYLLLWILFWPAVDNQRPLKGRCLMAKSILSGLDWGMIFRGLGGGNLERSLLYNVKIDNIKHSSSSTPHGDADYDAWADDFAENIIIFSARYVSTFLIRLVMMVTMMHGLADDEVISPLQRRP